MRITTERHAAKTTPALASLLTGVYPQTTKVRGLNDTLAPDRVKVPLPFLVSASPAPVIVALHV